MIIVSVLVIVGVVSLLTRACFISFKENKICIIYCVNLKTRKKIIDEVKGTVAGKGCLLSVQNYADRVYDLLSRV